MLGTGSSPARSSGASTVVLEFHPHTTPLSAAHAQIRLPTANLPAQFAKFADLDFSKRTSQRGAHRLALFGATSIWPSSEKFHPVYTRP